MSVQLIRDLLLGCLVVNAGVLLLWVGLIAVAGDFIYRVHSKVFKHLSREAFDAIHYGGIAVFKTAVFAFNGVPALVLWFM